MKNDLVKPNGQATTKDEHDPSKPPYPARPLAARQGRTMNHFQYKDGVLCAEDVRLDRLAEEVGTPFYCYSTATLERHYKVFADALAGGIR